MNKFLDNRMTIYEYGNPTADVVLIQLVGDHDLHDIENEITEIRNLINKDFRFIVVKVNNWYQELTPWKACSKCRVTILFFCFLAPLTAIVHARDARHAKRKRIYERQVLFIGQYACHSCHIMIVHE